ncbi:hypothetical protein F2Q69_00044218 [Brassica cretica]|uniref:Uncharacterized protein n=1 Tax=Brassica cretica TaxID=69181 RepID=A0A8S9NS68_BRACR|nr:hypothetical protein F2Q69_00044218 [Brassica cretica]
MTEARSSTEAGRRVVLQVRQAMMQYLFFRCSRGCVMITHEETDGWSMHISWGRKSWCGAHLVGEKSTFCVKVSRDRDTEGDLIERDKLLEVLWVVLKQWLKYLTEERHKQLFCLFDLSSAVLLCLHLALTDSSDVYSFRVVLIEALCAGLYLTLAEKKMNLAEWALNCYKKGMLDQIVDPFLKGKITPECFKKFAEINRYEMCTRPGHRETVYGRCSVELRVRVAASGKRGREREGDME